MDDCFSIWVGGRARKFPRLIDAEAAARRWVAKNRESLEVRGSAGLMATVRLDAMERIWTDLAPDGAALL